MLEPLPAVPVVLDDDVVPASARGIVRCLCALADEAKTLDLPATRTAIETAVKVGLLESSCGAARISDRLLH